MNVSDDGLLILLYIGEHRANIVIFTIFGFLIKVAFIFSNDFISSNLLCLELFRTLWLNIEEAMLWPHIIKASLGFFSIVNVAPSPDLPFPHLKSNEPD